MSAPNGHAGAHDHDTGPLLDLYACGHPRCVADRFALDLGQRLATLTAELAARCEARRIPPPKPLLYWGDATPVVFDAGTADGAAGVWEPRVLLGMARAAAEGVRE